MCATSPDLLRRALNTIDPSLEEGTRRALEAECATPGFWARPDARAILAQLHCATERAALAKAGPDIDLYAQALNDPDLAPEAQDALDALGARLEEACSPSPHAHLPAILTITAGAGGQDARDFCAMTLRELVRYAQRRGLHTDIQDETHDGTGLREATVRCSGPRAFAIMRQETGKRRLVRLSPFGAGGRQTSFCAITAVPEVPVEEVRIDAHDLRIETYRDTGPGGQHRNTTDSAVRITHLPTGLSAKSAARSQHDNRRIALATLAARLAEHARAEADMQTASLRTGQSDTGFGGHVRSLILHPYQLVRNEQTGQACADVSSYLDGGCLGVRAPF